MGGGQIGRFLIHPEPGIQIFGKPAALKLACRALLALGGSLRLRSGQAPTRPYMADQGGRGCPLPRKGCIFSTYRGKMHTGRSSKRPISSQ